MTGFAGHAPLLLWNGMENESLCGRGKSSSKGEEEVDGVGARKEAGIVALGPGL